MRMLRNGHGQEQLINEASMLHALSLFADEDAGTGPQEADPSALPVGASWLLLAIVSGGSPCCLRNP